STNFAFAPHDAQLQPDGKVVLSGVTLTGYEDIQLHPLDTRFNVLRLNQSGQIDSTFQADPKLGQENGNAAGLTQQPDGKLLVVGLINNPSRPEKADADIVRLLNDGAQQPPPPPPTTQHPYKWPFGERELIQAEWFDYGGEGVAYHDDTPGNQSGTFRSGEDVDIADITGGQIVNRANQGEWLEYT